MKRPLLNLIRRFSSTSVSGNEVFVHNRNPRNLERLSIGYKPSGWSLDNPGRCFWHKLTLEKTARHITANVLHFSGAVPVTASTKEWAIRKHLYSNTDLCAYTNLGRIFANRCLETGITEMSCFFDEKEGEKVKAFLEQVTNAGVSLQEVERYVNPKPSDIQRPEKSWTVHW